MKLKTILVSFISLTYVGFGEASREPYEEPECVMKSMVQERNNSEGLCPIDSDRKLTVREYVGSPTGHAPRKSKLLVPEGPGETWDEFQKSRRAWGHGDCVKLCMDVGVPCTGFIGCTCGLAALGLSCLGIEGTSIILLKVSSITCSSLGAFFGCWKTYKDVERHEDIKENIKNNNYKAIDSEGSTYTISYDDFEESPSSYEMCFGIPTDDCPDCYIGRLCIPPIGYTAATTLSMTGLICACNSGAEVALGLSGSLCSFLGGCFGISEEHRRREKAHEQQIKYANYFEKSRIFKHKYENEITHLNPKQEKR